TAATWPRPGSPPPPCSAATASPCCAAGARCPARSRPRSAGGADPPYPRRRRRHHRGGRRRPPSPAPPAHPPALAAPGRAGRGGARRRRAGVQGPVRRHALLPQRGRGRGPARRPGRQAVPPAGHRRGRTRRRRHVGHLRRGLQRRRGGGRPHRHATGHVRPRHPRGDRGPLARRRRGVRQRPHADQARRELRGQGRLRGAPRRRHPGRRGATGMNAALGTAGIVLGVAASLGGVVTLAVALVQRKRHLQAVGRSYVLLALVGAVVAFAAMERALITRDFTIDYVAQNGSSKTPALYNVATLWAALEGSILLWVLTLTGYMTLVVHKFRHRQTDPL